MKKKFFFVEKWQNCLGPCRRAMTMGALRGLTISQCAWPFLCTLWPFLNGHTGRPMASSAPVLWSWRVSPVWPLPYRAPAWHPLSSGPLSSFAAQMSPDFFSKEKQTRRGCELGYGPMDSVITHEVSYAHFLCWVFWHISQSRIQD